MDSTKPACSDIASDVWLWCLSTNNFVTAVHLPGCTNIEADFESRTDRHQIERHLNPIVFQGITLQLGICDMDLFASRVNAQLNKYVSWKPDPGAFAVDVFTLDWSGFRTFCFPPFSLTPRVLQKVEASEADCVLVPMWTTQAWFSKLFRRLINNPVLLPMEPELLTHPLTGQSHPFLKRLRLLACALSGKPWKRRKVWLNQPILSSLPGDKALDDVTARTLKDGSNFVLNGRQIHFNQLLLD